MSVASEQRGSRLFRGEILSKSQTGTEQLY